MQQKKLHKLFDGFPSCHHKTWPCEEIMDVFKLLWDGQLRLDHVEEEGGGHDGPAIHLARVLDSA